MFRRSQQSERPKPAATAAPLCRNYIISTKPLGSVPGNLVFDRDRKSPRAQPWCSFFPRRLAEGMSSLQSPIVILILILGPSLCPP